MSACAANGIPIGSEIKQNHFKLIFLDVGLANSLLGLRLNNIIDSQNIFLINNGAIAKQVTGQLLRTIEPPYVEPSLYYWMREENRSSAEVDYVIQHQTHIVPIEVKSGHSGRLKSLHVYMALKKQPLAVRINADIPIIVEIDTHTLIQATAKYALISIPFYLIEQINRLLNEMFPKT